MDPILEPIFPFLPTWKKDSPQLAAMMEAFGEEWYANANFLNQMIVNNNYLFELFQVAQGRRTIKEIADTSYIVVSGDFDKILVFTNVLPVTVHVSAGLDFNVYGLQKGNGQVSYTGNEGVSVLPPVDSYARTECKGAMAALIRTAANEFSVIGKLQLI